MGGESASNGPNIVWKRTWSNGCVGGSDVERRKVHLPQRVPGSLLLLEVIGDGRPRDVKAGGTDLGVEAGQGMGPSTAVLPQSVAQVLNIHGVPVLAFRGDVGSKAFAEVEEEEVTFAGDKVREEGPPKSLTPEPPSVIQEGGKVVEIAGGASVSVGPFIRSGGHECPQVDRQCGGGSAAVSS
jgi:hypothetical protein